MASFTSLLGNLGRRMNTSLSNMDPMMLSIASQLMANSAPSTRRRSLMEGMGPAILQGQQMQQAAAERARQEEERRKQASISARMGALFRDDLTGKAEAELFNLTKPLRSQLPPGGMAATGPRSGYVSTPATHKPVPVDFNRQAASLLAEGGDYKTALSLMAPQTDLTERERLALAGGLVRGTPEFRDFVLNQDTPETFSDLGFSPEGVYGQWNDDTNRFEEVRIPSGFHSERTEDGWKLVRDDAEAEEPSAPEAEIARLRANWGVDERWAQALADGHVTVTTSPVTGNTTLTNRIDGTSTEVALPSQTAGPISLVDDIDFGLEKPLEEAARLGTGLASNIRALWNIAAGFVGAGVPAEDTSVARNVLRQFNVSAMDILGAAEKDGRVTNQQMEWIREFLVDPRSLSKNPWEAEADTARFRKLLTSSAASYRASADGANITAKQRGDLLDSANSLDRLKEMMGTEPGADLGNYAGMTAAELIAMPPPTDPVEQQQYIDAINVLLGDE